MKIVQFLLDYIEYINGITPNQFIFWPKKCCFMLIQYANLTVFIAQH